MITKGRIVFYKHEGVEHVALVIKVLDKDAGCVNLLCFDESGDNYFRGLVLPGDGHAQWAFPKREEVRS